MSDLRSKKPMDMNAFYQGDGSQTNVDRVDNPTPSADPIAGLTIMRDTIRPISPPRTEELFWAPMSTCGPVIMRVTAA